MQNAVSIPTPSRRVPLPQQGNPMIEYFKNPLWDTQTMTATSTQLTFFSTPMSSTVNLRLTNMLLAGSLSKPRTAHVYGCTLKLKTGVPLADQRLFYNNTHLVFTIGTKNYLEIPCSEIPSGTGLYGVVSEDAAAAPSLIEEFNNGLPTLNNMLDMTVAGAPLYIPSLQNFSATIYVQPAQAGISASFEVRFILWCVLGREVM